MTSITIEQSSGNTGPPTKQNAGANVMLNLVDKRCSCRKWIGILILTLEMTKSSSIVVADEELLLRKTLLVVA